jgi:hypothetical protein
MSLRHGSTVGIDGAFPSTFGAHAIALRRATFPERSLKLLLSLSLRTSTVRRVTVVSEVADNGNVALIDHHNGSSRFSHGTQLFERALLSGAVIKNTHFSNSYTIGDLVEVSLLRDTSRAFEPSVLFVR